jgi:hypothetical protein
MIIPIPLTRSQTVSGGTGGVNVHNVDTGFVLPIYVYVYLSSFSTPPATVLQAGLASNLMFRPQQVQ